MVVNGEQIVAVVRVDCISAVYVENYRGKFSAIISMKDGDKTGYKNLSTSEEAQSHVAAFVQRLCGKCANPKCGREFEQRHGHQRYCSLKCRRQNDYLRHKAERSAKNRAYWAANSEMLNWKHLASNGNQKVS